MTDKTEAPELKPCPLASCRGEARIEKAFLGRYRAACQKCGLSTPWQGQLMDSPTHPAIRQRDRWNTRTDAYAEVTPEMREGVIDQIEQTISDTHDVDTTDRHYAENVFDNNIECISVAIHKELIHAREEAHAAGRAEALEEVAKWHDEVAAHDQSGMDYSDAVGVPISNYAHLKLNVKAHEYSSKYIRALNKEQGE